VAVLHQAAEQLTGAHLGAVHFTDLSPISPEHARYWSALARHVTRDVMPDPYAVASPLIVAATAHSVAAAMLYCFPRATAGELHRRVDGMPVHPATLRRAVAFIDDNAHRAVTLGDIVVASGISVRALQQAFRRHYGTTPTGYLRQVRLTHAHAALQAADPARGDTVAAIAVRWGFVKASRFAESYRRTYGVTPRETLRT
jgi:transcriptional regulator GlxA family with amidase domain